MSRFTRPILISDGLASSFGVSGSHGAILQAGRAESCPSHQAGNYGVRALQLMFLNAEDASAGFPKSMGDFCLGRQPVMQCCLGRGRRKMTAMVVSAQEVAEKIGRGCRSEEGRVGK